MAQNETVYQPKRYPDSLAVGTWSRAILAGGLIGLLTGLTALALVLTEPLIMFVGIVALGIGLLALTNLSFALVFLVAVGGLLPFGTLPFQVAITPSLIDSALALVLVVYLGQWMTGRRRDLHTVPVQWLFFALILVMVFAFVLGSGHATPTAGTMRRFVAMLANIALALVIVDIVRNEHTLRQIATAIIVVGAIAAAIGIVLWLLPDLTAESILNRLGRIGYPVGGVIHYRENAVVVLNERAIGTWIAPNSFGGFLMMVGALSAPQLLAKRPVTGYRSLAFVLLAVIGVGLFLSDSRGSMLAFVAGTSIIAILRYRKLIWPLLALIVFVLVAPPTQAFVTRLIAGFTGADLETQMRLGEYKDALTLIGRYPVLGVGFSAPPDIDLYIGFANTYLTILAHAGMIGLLVYLLTLAGVFGYGYFNRHRVRDNEDLVDVWLGLAAGIIGVLVAGIFDHFYFNIEFQPTTLFFWLFVGLFLAATRIVAQPDEDKSVGLSPLPATTKLQEH